MLQVISVEELRPGMFVNNVVEQTGTLKIKSKGLVKSDKSIAVLKQKGVVSIEIDLSKSHQTVTAETSAEEETTTKLTKSEPKRSVGEQIQAADLAYNKARDIQRDFFQSMKEEGRADLDIMHNLSHKLLNSVLEAPSAMTCIALLRKTNEYQLEHSLNCSILLGMFGKHLNMDASLVEELSFAGLLMDVGMANVPADILESPDPLSALDKEIVSTHVDVGLDLVERSGGVSDLVRDIIFNHHERVDGSGYPDQKSAANISEYVQMASIVDSYDAMTSPRPYRKSYTPTMAMKKLMQDEGYDKTLVQQFIQCQGVHPTGSLVRLTNGKLGIVVKPNAKFPLEPTVVVFYNLKSNHYEETKTLDLRRSNAEIAASVKPEEFGLNLTKFFKEVFFNGVF